MKHVPSVLLFSLSFVLSLSVAGAAGGQVDLPFSPARWAGDLLFLSGQVGNVPGTLELVEGGIEGETRQALEKIRDLVEEHGGTMADVVKCTVMLDDISQWAAMNEVYVEFFPSLRPTRSALGADGLAIGAAVEIECLAYLPRVVARSLGPAALENGSSTAEVNGRLVHYVVHGEGPPLMVVPNSWGLTIEGLRGLLGPLESHLTMIYFDPRGMGSSGPAEVDEDLSLAAVREDFDALRRHLGLERVHALGWSNGATNLVYLADEHPETLASAIFVHGTPRFAAADMEAIGARHPDLFRRFAETQERLLSGELSPEEQDRELRKLYLDDWFPTMLAHRERTGEALQTAFADAQLSWRHARHAQTEGQGGIDQTGLLSGIPVPSLVIAGAHDALPPERSRELAEGLPRARFVVFDDSGHFAPIEEPHRFVDLVTNFLGVDR